jgi:uncharacterized lipoprotein YbaY
MTRQSLIQLLALLMLLPSAETFSQTGLKTALTSGAQQGTRFSRSWLDRTLVNWNRRMSRLPTPDRSLLAAEDRRRCRDLIREANTLAERALVRAGWTLYGPVQSSGSTQVVTALSGVDGQCRPLGFQAFVYWDGRYAGTLSPLAMNSRTDGALTNVQLASPTRISAEFVRYNDSDPLCCPTRVSEVTYEVSRDDMALVTPVNVDTRRVEAPAEETEPDDGPGNPAARLFSKRWRLTEVDAIAIRTTKPFIEFNGDAKRFTGDGGCNRISGSFEIEGRNLRLSRVISTKRACLDREVQQVETDFLNALPQTTRFRIQQDTLRFFADRRPILTFTADATEPGGASEEARVTGTVTYFQRSALPPGAVVEVRLVNISQVPAVTVAEQIVEPRGRQVPIEFEIRYDPRRIERRYRYSIQARILQNDRALFASTEPYLVITGGNPTAVEVTVRPVRR